MRIMFINNDGGGFADYIEVPEGMTMLQLFEQQVPSSDPSSFRIQVNRQPVARDYQLREGDRVSVTPVKVEAGHLRHSARNGS